MRISDWSSDVCSSDLRVSVEDRGAGVPAGLEKTIFEKFTQANLKSPQTGAGLGLSICRAIIQAHGGRIGIDTLYRPGTRFWFTLPLGSPPSSEDSTHTDILNPPRSEEHTSELQSLMRISYAVFCLNKKHSLSHLLSYT